VRVLVAGMLAGTPGHGGATWAVLQYIRGLEQLGHEVVAVEPVARADERQVAYHRSLDLPAAALLLSGSRRTIGLPYQELAGFGADVLLNISGMLRDETLLEQIPVRAFIDLDPGFTQVWHEQGEDMGLALHTHFVTVGARVGAGECPIPTCGREWITTLPPVALAHWPYEPRPASLQAFTSVGHWRSYGSLEHRGIHYGQRAHSLRELLPLPRLVGDRFELALGIHPREHRDLAALSANGWGLLDPARVACTPAAYQAFVRGSEAELCVAKSGYVASHSGWFSDRSACYLASGRPVLAQRTGFELGLPTGEGLLAFSDTAEAAEAVREIGADRERHRRAARALAEEHLDARRVLDDLLTAVAG
jgi:Glycosyl transferases group 1